MTTYQQIQEKAIELRSQRDSHAGLAVRTQETIDTLASIVAGQSAELAELKQCMLILAKSAKQVEEGVQIIRHQTATKVMSWSDIRKEINAAWRDIIDETKFFNDDAMALAIGRGLQSILSFGTASPALIHATKAEVRNHRTKVKALLERINKFADLAKDQYPDEFSEYLSSSSKLVVNSKAWTLSFAVSNKDRFLNTLDKQLRNMRGLQ